MTTPGSSLKFQRARKHLADAQSAVANFLDSRPYDIARDEETEPGKLLFWVTLLEEPPAEISLAAGDAIHNMRSALDHIVYELSSKRKTNPSNTSFPLFSKEEDWDKRDKNGALQTSCGLYRVRLLPDEAQTLIYNLQPCPRPQVFMPDAWGPNRKKLRELHDLDILDKHKTLNLAVFDVDVLGIKIDDADSPIRAEYVFKGALHANARTLVLRLFYPTKVYVEFMPKLDIVLSEGPGMNEPVGWKLEQIFRNVGTVLNALSHFA
jgi:hypothetical protein